MTKCLGNMQFDVGEQKAYLIFHDQPYKYIIAKKNKVYNIFSISFAFV